MTSVTAIVAATANIKGVSNANGRRTGSCVFRRLLDPVFVRDFHARKSRDKAKSVSQCSKSVSDITESAADCCQSGIDREQSVVDCSQSGFDCSPFVTDSSQSDVDWPQSITDRSPSVFDWPQPMTDNFQSVSDQPQSVPDQHQSGLDLELSVTDCSRSEVNFSRFWTCGRKKLDTDFTDEHGLNNQGTKTRRTEPGKPVGLASL